MDSMALVPLLAHSIFICTGKLGAGSSRAVIGLTHVTVPEKRCGVVASIHSVSGASRVMKVGDLSSLSNSQSLSESQSLAEYWVPLRSTQNSPSSKWSKSRSSRVSLSSSSSIASGPVNGSFGFARASPSPKSSWSQGLVEFLSNLIGQTKISSLSSMPSSSSSSSISSRRPSLSWSNAWVSETSNSTSLVRPSASQSSSAQLEILSLSWSHGDCSSPVKQPGSNSCAQSSIPLLSSS